MQHGGKHTTVLSFLLKDAFGMKIKNKRVFFLKICESAPSFDILWFSYLELNIRFK